MIRTTFTGIISFFLLSHLAAQTWTNLGPCGSETFGNRVASQGGTGSMHCIRFDPDNPQTVYAGSPYAGLWKSTDGGKNWSASEIDIHQDLPLCSVSDIAITSSNGQKRIWIATGHPATKGPTDLYTTGIYFSDDEGKTFQPLESFNTKYHFGFRYQKNISRITVHPHNPDIIFVATSDGIYRTTNGGKSWELVFTEEKLPESAEKIPLKVEFSKSDPDHVIYASGRDVYRSVKDGAKGTFKSMTHYGLDWFEEGFDCVQHLNLSIDVNKDSLNEDILYAYGYIKGDTCGKFKKRSSLVLFLYNGKNWEPRNSVPNPNSQLDPLRLEVASVPGTPSIVYVGTVISSVSSDYGQTWKKCTDYDRPGHADIHAIEVIPGTKDMLTGTDGGIFHYSYETGKVDEYNDGLCVTTVIQMATSATNPKKILIGNQDTGADLWDGTNWTKLPTGGDGYAGQLINRTDENDFFTCANYSFFENAGATAVNLRRASICSKPAGSCPLVFVQSPNQANVFYYSEKELFKSEDNCKTWCQISEFNKMQGVYINPMGHIISCIAVAPSDSNIIYVSYNATGTCCDSYLFKTSKGGMTCEGKCSGPTGENNWTNLTSIPRIVTGDGHQDFLENSYFNIDDIAISDKNPDKVWICYASQRLNPIEYKVYKTTDGGETWLPDEKGLPDFPCTSIVYVNGSNDELFAGSYDGVYIKHGTEDWKRYGSGLPKMFVTSMEINYVARKLRVSTFGRGVWEIDLP